MGKRLGQTSGFSSARGARWRRIIPSPSAQCATEALTRMESTLFCTALLRGTETKGVRAEQEHPAAPRHSSTHCGRCLGFPRLVPPCPGPSRPHTSHWGHWSTRSQSCLHPWVSTAPCSGLPCAPTTPLRSCVLDPNPREGRAGINPHPTGSLQTSLCCCGALN